MTLHPPGGMIFDKHDKSRRYLTLMSGLSARVGHTEIDTLNGNAATKTGLVYGLLI